MRAVRRIVAVAAALVASGAVQAQAAPGPGTRIDWVTIGAPHNPADTRVMGDGTSGYGSVPYTYRISRFDVTNAQYAEFLNAKARVSDPYLLYVPTMDHAQGLRTGTGIVRSGPAGDYHYAPAPGRARRPVDYVTIYAAMRFVNWLNNGKGNASTETGAYTLLGGSPLPTNGAFVTRNPGARMFLPTEDEWYKAAYYDRAHRRYFAYPQRSNTAPACTRPTAKRNTADCNLAGGNDNPAGGAIVDVGSYRGSAGPFGTFDQGGLVYQWTETLTTTPPNDSVPAGQIPAQGQLRVIRGAGYAEPAEWEGADQRDSEPGEVFFADVGFRVASVARS